MKGITLSRSRRAILCSLLTLVIIAIYLPTLTWLGRQWLGSGLLAEQARNWSQGPLVVVLMSYLLWRRRELLSGQGSLKGVPLIVSGLGLHWASLVWVAPYLSAYSLIPIALGLVGLFFGLRTSYRLLPILLLFLLAVPFPADQWGVTGLLAQVVAMASTVLAQLAGAPVLRQGQFITVGQAEYSVEPLCSGFNFIMALLALMLPIFYLRGASLRFLGGAVFGVASLGLLAKITQVTTLLMVTPWLGQDTALVFYHRWLGVLFYLGSLGLALVLASLISRRHAQRLVAA